MTALPKLMTVRDKPAVETTPPPVGHPGVVLANVASPTSPTVHIPGLENPRLLVAARRLLTEAVQSGILPVADVRRFLTAVGDRLPQMNNSERTCDALLHHGFITQYQRTRLVSGQTFGLMLGNYRILDRIGGGTVSAVFLAEHTVLKRQVAVKVLAADESVRPEIRERFLDEARMLAGMNHPNVVLAFDAGILEHPTDPNASLWYLVLELVLGGDIEQNLYESGPVTIPLACEWARQIAEGLRAAHDAGLTHRDLKPSNLLLTESRHVKLTDFGLAREWGSTRTPTRCELGTLGFSAPEQIDDPNFAGPASDIYALGVTLFWFLTGKLPHRTDCPPSQQMKEILTVPPTRLKSLLSHTPQELDDYVARMLSRNPAARPTAAEAARAFVALADVSPHPEVSGKLLRPEESLDEDALRFAVQALEQTTVALRYDALNAQSAVLTALATAISTRAAEPAGHLKRMTRYVRSIALHLGKLPAWAIYGDPDTVDELARVAAIHDLGWLALPATLPADADQRTQSEDHEYRSHPMLGLKLLDSIAEGHGEALPFLRVARAVIRNHHERWQGGGFPDGLVGADIPRPARLVAIADYYDTLRCDTPEKSGYSHLDAVDAIRAEAGKRFDPDVVETFRRWSREWETIFDTIPD